MSLQSKIPKKIDFTPKKHHGFQAVLMLFGFLLPPIAVALRFGIDFFVNVILTICGYFPSHGHNFYIQNIRNNENKARTPKWALKAGLVDTDNLERRKRKNAWATRYDERNNESAHVGQDLEEGEEGDNYAPISEAERIRAERRQREGLWADEDADEYNPAPNQRHWHYPANFEGTVAPRTERREPQSRGSVDSITGATAYGTPGGGGGHDDDVPEWGKDYGSGRKPASRNPFNKKKSKTVVSDWHDDAGQAPGGGRGYADDVALEDGWSGAKAGRTGASTAKSNGGDRYGSGGGGDRYGSGAGDRYDSGAGGRSTGYAESAPAPKKQSANGDPNWEHEF